MNKVKHLIVICLTLLVALGLTAYAEGDEVQWGAISQGNSSTPDSWAGTGTMDEALAYAKTLAETDPTKAAYIQLLSDLSPTAPIDPDPSTYIILDLKEDYSAYHSIDRHLTSATENGNVITVRGNMTITGFYGSCSITGGYNTAAGGGIIVESGGSLTLRGANITGNKSSTCGGGIYVNPGAGQIKINSGAHVLGNYSISNGKTISDDLYLSSGKTISLGYLGNDWNSNGIVGVRTEKNTPGTVIAVAESDSEARNASGFVAVRATSYGRLFSNTQQCNLSSNGTSVVLADASSSSDQAIGGFYDNAGIWMGWFSRGDVNIVDMNSSPSWEYETYVKLMKDIVFPNMDTESAVFVSMTKPVTFDLNGHSLSRVDSTFNSTNDNGGSLIKIRNCTEKVTVKGNAGSVSKGCYYYGGGGVDVLGSPNVHIENIIIKNNRIESSEGKSAGGIGIRENSNVWLKDITVQNNEEIGVSVDATSSLYIEGNTIIDDNGSVEKNLVMGYGDSTYPIISGALGSSANIKLYTTEDRLSDGTTPILKGTTNYSMTMSDAQKFSFDISKGSDYILNWIRDTSGNHAEIIKISDIQAYYEISDQAGSTAEPESMTAGTLVNKLYPVKRTPQRVTFHPTARVYGR